MKNSNDIGKGIATAGIWIAVAIAASSIGFFTVPVAFFAVLGTAAVWG